MAADANEWQVCGSIRWAVCSERVLLAGVGGEDWHSITMNEFERAPITSDAATVCQMIDG